MQFDVEEIRSRLSIEDVLRDSGVVLRAGRGPCPICGTSSGSTSFSVRELRFRCFRCGNHGDVVELVARLTGKTWNETIPILATQLQLGERAVAAKREKPVDPQVEIGRMFREIADLRDTLLNVTLSPLYPPCDRGDAAIAMEFCNETLDFILEKLPWR